jgi:hypothetical protein
MGRRDGINALSYSSVHIENFINLTAVREIRAFV